MKTDLASPVIEESRVPSAIEPRAFIGGSRVCMKPRRRSSIRRTVTPERICVLTFDRPGSSANVFDRATLEELDAQLDFVFAKPQLRGLVLMSAKPAIFIAGADLHAMAALAGQPATAGAPELGSLIRLGQRVFNRLAALPIRTVAAIHGACLGGGCELCLACDERIATPDRATKIGLPETQLGILPAWGGCTRLPRLIGLPRALNLILAGRPLPASGALKCGLVDELVPRERLLETACRRILGDQPEGQRLNRMNGSKPSKPSGRASLLLSRNDAVELGSATVPVAPVGVPPTGPRPPACPFKGVSSPGVEVFGETPKTAGGTPRAPQRTASLRLGATNNALVAAVLAAWLRAKLWQRTRGHYPAVFKALEVVSRGVHRSFEESLAAEREAVLELARTDVCHNLVRLFFQQEHAKKRDTERASGEPTKAVEPPVRRCAVIGAGVMGSGIAHWLSARGVSVVVKDVGVAPVARGMANIARLYREGVKRHLLTTIEARQGLDRIFPTAGDPPLGGVDLVIEAAVEQMDLKQQILRRLASRTRPDTVLATNSSALSVTKIAAATGAPERVVGLHFFNPVHRMQLVEVVAGGQTAPAVVQRAVRFVQQIGKLPVVVQDRPGFLVNRILMPYLLEAGRLFEAGAQVRDIDEAMLDFGMPMGPLRLIDEVGVDVALHVAETLAARFPERFAVPALLRQMVEAGLLGRKSGHGFYFHGHQPPAVHAGLKLYQTSGTARLVGRAELQRRMVLLMINEAARCVEERVVATADEADFAMVMGAGFAPFRGGPLRYADTFGLDRVVRALNERTDADNAQFKPCDLLKDLSERHETFFAPKGGFP